MLIDYSTWKAARMCASLCLSHPFLLCRAPSAVSITRAGAAPFDPAKLRVTQLAHVESRDPRLYASNREMALLGRWTDGWVGEEEEHR